MALSSQWRTTIRSPRFKIDKPKSDETNPVEARIKDTVEVDTGGKIGLWLLACHTPELRPGLMLS